jgi:hypothetical protein
MRIAGQQMKILGETQSLLVPPCACSHNPVHGSWSSAELMDKVVH